MTMPYDPNELTFDRDHLRQAFVAGWEAALAFIATAPLSIHGRWERDTPYNPNAVVYHSGRQWITTVQTASEPGADNGAWRALDTPSPFGGA